MPTSFPERILQTTPARIVRTPAISLLSLVFLLVSTPCTASSVPADDGREKAAELERVGESGPTSAEVSGLRIYRDPATGELIENPTPDQLRAFEEKLLFDSHRHDHPHARSDAGLVPFTLEDGGRGVFLEGRFHSALRVHRDRSGSLHFYCAMDPSQDGYGARDDGPSVAGSATDGDAATDGPTEDGASRLGWPIR